MTSCQRIRRLRDVIITGPTGVGKSCVACALAHKASLEHFRTRNTRPPRLLKTLHTAREEGAYLTTLRQLAHIDVLVLDDWGLRRIRLPQQRDLMELLDDRYTA